MEAETKSRSKLVSAQRESALPWHDLRSWIAQIEQHGELARINAEVDPHEELGAVTLLASRQHNSPALMFEKLKGDTTHSRILINMLGASRERYALAVGLDPGHPLDHERADSAGDGPQGSGAGERGGADRQGHRPHQVPGANLLARRWRPVHWYRRYHPHSLARDRSHQCRMLPADAAGPEPHWPLLLPWQAWPS